MFCGLIESAKMNGLDPGAYLRHGAEAFLRGKRVPLPHELRDLAIVRPWLSQPMVAAIEPARWFDSRP